MYIKKQYTLTRALKQNGVQHRPPVYISSLNIHSSHWHVQRWLLAILRSFFHSSLLSTLSFHLFPPTSLPSSPTSTCHLFLGLPLNLVASKFTHITFLGEFYFLPFSVHAQTNIIYLTFKLVKNKNQLQIFTSSQWGHSHMLTILY